MHISQWAWPEALVPMTVVGSFLHRGHALLKLQLASLSAHPGSLFKYLRPTFRQEILGPVGSRPCLLLVSGDDECVPRKDAIADRAEMLRTAIGVSAQLHIVRGAPHNLAGVEQEAVEVVCAFLEDLP